VYLQPFECCLYLLWYKLCFLQHTSGLCAAISLCSLRLLHSSWAEGGHRAGEDHMLLDSRCVGPCFVSFAAAVCLSFARMFCFLDPFYVPPWPCSGLVFARFFPCTALFLTPGPPHVQTRAWMRASRRSTSVSLKLSSALHSRQSFSFICSCCLVPLMFT
jgi:hypothetical protein